MKRYNRDTPAYTIPPMPAVAPPAPRTCENCQHCQHCDTCKYKDDFKHYVSSFEPLDLKCKYFERMF